MSQILMLLLGNFFEDAFPFVDILFSKLIDIVFFVENHISDNSIFENTYSEVSRTNLAFDTLFKVTMAYGIGLLIIKFTKKIIDVYMIGIEGDSSVSVERMILGFMKALIIIFCFGWVYEIFANISIEFINDLLEAVGLSTKTSLMHILTNTFGTKTLFGLLALLVFFICYLILILQFIKRGLEMLILRLGIPIACTGLIDSDNGVFAPYAKLFIQNSVTVVVQLALLKLGFGVLENGNLFFGISALLLGIKTPQFIQQFMIGVGSGGISMMTINQTANMMSRVTRMMKR